MATTVPAMKGRLGNTDYYVLSMKAQEQGQDSDQTEGMGRSVH